MGIKNFLLRLLIFSIVSFPFITFKSAYSYFTDTYKCNVRGSEIYVSIKKSKTKKKVKKLIIGDSAGKQLYDNNTYNDSIYSLTCNQAISAVGYYILLENFIRSNKGQLPDEVIMIINPRSLLNNLDQIYTYQYFLKPFNKPGNQVYLNELCKKQIHKVPYYYTSQFPFIVNSNWTPYYNAGIDSSFGFISPISNEYLLKIKQLCSSNNLPLSIYSPPLSLANKQNIIAYSHCRTEFKKCELEKEFTEYFKKIKFLPDRLFSDHMHFKKQYIPVDYLNLQKEKLTEKKSL